MPVLDFDPRVATRHHSHLDVVNHMTECDALGLTFLESESRSEAGPYFELAEVNALLEAKLKRLMERRDAFAADRGCTIDKPRRYQNPRYLAFVRTMPCVVCRHGIVDAHHAETRGAGGTDLCAIPLCRIHHGSIHRIGVKTFPQHYRIDIVECQLRLLQKFTERHKCLGTPADQNKE